MMTKEGSTKTVNFMTPRGRGSCAGAWQYKSYGEKTSLLPGDRTDKLFQPNLTQSIHGWGGLKFVQMKDHIIFQRGKIWLTLLIVKITRLLIISISPWGESGLSQVLSIYLFPRPLWLHQSLSGTRGPVFSFRWFCSRFLLDSLSFFYHQVSMRWLFLHAWCCLFSMHFLTISTIFTWWQCLSFPFRSFALPPHLLPSVASKSLIFSSGLFV